jgi:putative NIF3 family GTP cyclohydrolase 1 type 2
MKSRTFSRRTFVLAAPAAYLSGRTLRAQNAPITVQQLLERIRVNIGVPWRATTVDGLKAGNPATTVTGIATTVMATIDVLRKAVASGRNVVITQEPTYYAGNDEPGSRAQDPVYLAKKAFIDERHLVIVRLSDHWNAREPSEPATALAAALGWSTSQASGTGRIYTLPETTLGALTAHIKSRLGLRGGLRTVGRLDMRVRSVFVSPGTADVPGAVANLSRFDVVVAGEPREWETVPYILDAQSAGQAKAMIAVGRLVSQAPGMRACAAWLRSLTPDVPVEDIPVSDPYWSPLP